MNADAAAVNERNRKITIGFNNFAHAVDHYVMLIFPTVAIGLQAIYARSYAELMALAAPSFFAFGLFSRQVAGQGRADREPSARLAYELP